MGRLYFVGSSLVLTIVLFVSAIVAYKHFIHSPLQKSTETVVYILKPGVGANVMVYQLKKQGVLTKWQAQLMCAWLQYQGLEKSLKAGEYLIPLSISPEKLIDKISKGAVIQYPFTIVEGSTFDDILVSLSKLPKLKQTLLGKSPQDIMASLGINTHPEGQFFPETYFYTLNMSDADILKRAHQLMQTKLQTAWHARSIDCILKTPYEALILASIIEKEAVHDAERAQISGIFQRRLSKNMRLQTDPTVIYGLQKNYSGRLTREALKLDTPYNTYVHKGLPPTPIAMAGMKSILAALHPDKSNTLYFVAKGDGSHSFSESLQEHNIAVEQYQLNKTQPIFKALELKPTIRTCIGLPTFTPGQGTINDSYDSKRHFYYH
jgi:UPF0755 protein